MFWSACLGGHPFRRLLKLEASKSWKLLFHLEWFTYLSDALSLLYFRGVATKCASSVVVLREREWCACMCVCVCAERVGTCASMHACVRMCVWVCAWACICVWDKFTVNLSIHSFPHCIMRPRGHSRTSIYKTHTQEFPAAATLYLCGRGSDSFFICGVEAATLSLFVGSIEIRVWDFYTQCYTWDGGQLAKTVEKRSIHNIQTYCSTYFIITNNSHVQLRRWVLQKYLILIFTTYMLRRQVLQQYLHTMRSYSYCT